MHGHTKVKKKNQFYYLVVLMKNVFSLRTVGTSRETTISGMKYTQEERLEI